MSEAADTAPVTDGDWALIDLTDDLMDRATRVANDMSMHIEQFLAIAVEEKLERMGLRHGPGRAERPKWMLPADM